MLWPNDRGPLRTLRDAGLNTGDVVPAWIRRAHVFTDAEQDVYLSHPAFLAANDLAQLAAIARDGYEVSAYPRSDGRIRVVIRKDVTP